jgi:hypothetical protein
MILSESSVLVFVQPVVIFVPPPFLFIIGYKIQKTITDNRHATLYARPKSFCHTPIYQGAANDGPF